MNIKSQKKKNKYFNIFDTKLLMLFVLIVWIFIILISFASAETTETHGLALSNTQGYNRAVGFFYSVNEDDLNITSVLRASNEDGDTFTIWGNDTTNTYYFRGTFTGSDNLTIGIKLNASTTYIFTIHNSGCANRNNANQFPDSISYPYASTFGTWEIGAISDATCGGTSWIENDADGYAILSINVTNLSISSPPVTPVTFTINTNLVNNTINYNNPDINITYNATFNPLGSYDIADCFLEDNITILDTQLSVNLSILNNFHYNFGDVEQDFNFKIKCDQDNTIYNVTQFNYTTGTLLNGNLTSIETRNDSLNMSFVEQTGSPAFNLFFNFTDVTTVFTDLFLRYNYLGSSSHNINYNIFNFSNSEWVTINTLDENLVFQDIGFDCGINCGDYINGNNTVSINIEHTSSGNINHIFALDYLSLHYADVNSSTGLYLYKVDTVSGIITDDYTNNSIINTGDILTITTTYNDTNSFAYNFSIKNTNGDIIQNVFAENLTGGIYTNVTSYTFTLAGNYSFVWDFWDSHTAKESKPVQWFVGENTIIMDNYLILEGDIKEEKTIFRQSEDKSKFLFKITWNEDSTIHYLNISSSKGLTFDLHQGIQYNFVSLFLERWIDFKGENIKNVDVKYLGNNKYNLKIELYNPSDEIEFQSIGSLNKASQIKYLEVVNPEVQLLTDIKTELQNISEGINMSWAIFLIALFIIVGFWTKIYPIISLSSIGFVMLYMNAGTKFISTGTSYYKVQTYVFLVLAILFALFGIIMEILKTISDKKRIDEQNEFYQDY